jgi:hypothetical protein
MEGMHETNLGAMLEALRNNAEACKEQGNRHFGEGARAVRLQSCRLPARR